MPTNKTAEASSKGQSAKGTTQNGRLEGSKEVSGLIHQNRTNKAVAGMPLNTHHQCVVYNYCLHGDCGIELKETEKYKVPFSHRRLFALFASTVSKQADSSSWTRPNVPNSSPLASITFSS
jgi:hypothetical protein